MGKAVKKSTPKVKKEKVEKQKVKLIPRRKILRRSRSAWVFFASDRRAEILKSNPKLTFGEISKQLSPQWQAMSDQDKKPYYDLYIKDKQRYIDEKKALSPQLKKMLRIHTRTKHLKKKGRPSAVLSAYMIFVKTQHSKITAQHPNASFLEVGKIMGACWRGMNEEEKQVYVKEHQLDQERFKHEMVQYVK